VLTNSLMVVAYLGVAMFIIRRLANGTHPGSLRRFWIGTGLFLITLAFVRLLGVHTALTENIRTLTLEHDWYRGRRPFQIAGLTLITTMAIRHQRHWFQRCSGDCRYLTWAMTGTFTLLAVLVLRLVSYHHTDLIIHHSLGVISLGSMAELLGLGLIALSTRLPD